MRGLKLDEPATALTDAVMAAFATYWAASLLAAGVGAGDRGVAISLWGVGFAATALAALLGAVVHGYQSRMRPATAAFAWRATLHSAALASGAMVAAVLLVYPDSGLRTAALALVGLKFAVTTAVLGRRPEFGVVLLDHGLALAAVLALQIAAWGRWGAASGPWIVAGVALSVVAGAVQALRIAPHARFNHNDLYHVLQVGALWLLYRGGLLLG